MKMNFGHNFFEDGTRNFSKQIGKTKIYVIRLQANCVKEDNLGNFFVINFVMVHSCTYKCCKSKNRIKIISFV